MRTSDTPELHLAIVMLLRFELVACCDAVAPPEHVAASATKRLEDEKLAFYDSERRVQHVKTASVFVFVEAQYVFDALQPLNRLCTVLWVIPSSR